MNILLAIDGSDHAARAVSAVIGFAGSLRETPRIDLLYVHLPIPIGFATRHVAREALDSYYHDEGQVILAPVAVQLEQAGLPVVTHIRVGSPGETIAHAAKDLGCDMVWMGTHGRGAVTQALLGSVASRVLALAGVPVTLVK